MSMQDRIAAVTSVVFSPFLVLIPTVLVIAQKSADVGQKRFLWILIVVTCFTILPALFIFVLFRMGYVSNLTLVSQEQRTVPIFFAIGTALAGVGALYAVSAPMELIWAGISYIANGAIFVAITQIWKISFHSGVAAGCITLLMFLVHVQLGWLLLWLPLIGWARVKRKRHTTVQTVVGALIAIITVSVVQLAKIGLRF